MRRATIFAIAASLALIAGAGAVAAEWSLPATDLSAGGENARFPTVVVDGSGVATTLWVPDASQPGAVRSARFVNGEWTAPQDVSAGGSAVTYPVAAVDPSGVVTALWTREQGGEYVVQASRHAGGSWSAPVTLSAPGGGAGYPAVVADGSGVVTAVWQRQVGAVVTVQSARYANGAWGAVQDVAVAGTTGVASNPQVAVDASGAVTALWAAWTGSENAVGAARSVGGAWTSPQIISPTGVSTSAFQPKIVAAPSGTVTAVWTQSLPGAYEVRYSQYSGGTWSTSAVISGSSTSGTAYPEPAVDPSGVVTVAWYQTVLGGGNEVRASRYSGGTWSSPALLSTTGQSAELPKVAANSSGQVVAAWEQVDGGLPRIATARYSGGSWSDAQLLSASGSIAQFPQLTVDDKGNVITVWEGTPDGFAHVVQAAQYFTVPAPPRRLAATPGNGSAEVAWTAPVSNAGSPITRYSVSASPGGRTCTAAPPATRCAISGLANGTSYVFSVTAANVLGTSWASTITATPAVPGGAGGGGGGGATTAPLTATITTSRRTVASGGRLSAGIRVRNTGKATATKVVACIKVPKNLAIVQKPRGKKLRNPACFTVKSLAVGKQVTRKVTLRATSTKRVKRSITGTARAKGIATVKATPRKVTVTGARRS